MIKYWKNYAFQISRGDVCPRLMNSISILGGEFKVIIVSIAIYTSMLKMLKIQVVPLVAISNC